MSKRRGLSTTFMNALLNNSDLGINSFLYAIKKDNTLSLEIRENYINIYYRGGSLIRISEIGGKFTASFDRNYILAPDRTRVPAIINKQVLVYSDDVTGWINAIPV